MRSNSGTPSRSSTSRKVRALEPLSTRKRYVAGWTSRIGQTLPLTTVNGAKASITPGSVLCTSWPVSRPPSSNPKLRPGRSSGTSYGGPLGNPVTFALVADDPQSRQPGVYVEPSDAHHVAVVPEQRRALVHRAVKDGELAGVRSRLSLSYWCRAGARPSVPSAPRRAGPACRRSDRDCTAQAHRRRRPRRRPSLR